MLIHGGMKLLFYGDSLTRRSGILDSSNPACCYSLAYRESYVDLVVKRLLVHEPELGFQFFNRGVGGDTVENLLERYQRDVKSIAPDLIILLIGQNDICSASLKRFEAGLRELLCRCAADGFQVMLLSTTAHRDREKMKRLVEADQIIGDLSAEFRCWYVDVKKPMERILRYNQNAQCPIELFTNDPHLSELGNILVADAVFDALTQPWNRNNQKG